MSNVFRFKMNGRTFAYDTDARITAAELLALQEIGLDHNRLQADLSRALTGDVGRIALDGLRAVCAVAYMVEIRENPDPPSWRAFLRTVYPDSFGPADEPVKVDEQVAAAAQQAAEPVPSLDPHPLFTATAHRGV